MVEMKDSEIKWIGNIPKHWEVHPVYSYFSERKNKNRLGKEQNLLSLSYGNIIKKDINSNGGLLPESFNTYNIIEENDIIIRPTDLQNDKRSLRTGLVKEHGIITSAYIDMKPKKEVNSHYFHYLLHSYDIQKVFYNMGNGVRQALNFSEFSKLMVFAPPLKEQNKIADFLDEKCAEIDSISTEIQEQVDTLEEYKKSVITEAVTKGLNPNAEMKDSGIEWIGQIPNNWDMKRTKYVSISFSKGNGITKEDVDSDGDIQCIRYGEIYSKYNIMFKNCISTTNLNKISSPKYIANGDILFAGTGELVEEIGKNIVYIGNKPCLAGGDIIILKHNQNPGFLNYVLCSQYAQIQKSLGKAKLKVVHISAFDIGNVRIALPPIEEQKKIADYLDSKCLEIDSAIKDKQKQLKILDEYKKTLIYEYVTGKKEVA